MSIVNRPAPDFQLEGVHDGEFVEISLDDYKGQWVILFFYPLDFTFVCPTELREFSRRHDEFEDLDARVLAVSVDSKYSHLAWQNTDLGDIVYPMLSDITRHTSRRYGVLLEDEGIALRGLFIIDPEGTVQYEVVHGTDVGRSVDETVRVLQALQTESLCPVGWQPGDPTLDE
ncbi:MAG: peroxiredoxin [Armatimonadota bacterium]